MKQLLFSLLMISCWTSANAQNSTDTMNIWGVGPGDTLMVYAEKAYVRQEPSLQAVIADTLFTGDEVRAWRNTEKSFTIKGINTQWEEITYGKNKKGYIWLGLMAIRRYTKDNVTFLYGIEKTIPGEFLKYLVRVKAINSEHKILDMKEWSVGGGDYANFSEGKMFGNMGLDNITTIVRIMFSGDACAIPTDYYYFGWTGQELIVLPGKSNVSDAGAYNSVETILFPTEIGGQPGKIIKMGLVEQFGEDMETVEKRTTSRETYLWDGKKVVKQ
jgi:hypothetical protein